MKKRINNTPYQEKRILTKKDLSLVYGLTFIAYLLGAYYCKNQLFGIITVCIAALFPLLLYITKIAKKLLNERIVNKYFGVIGVYDAVICAFFAAYQKSSSTKEMLCIFAVLCVLILVVIALLELFLRKRISNSSGANSPIIATFATLGSVFGMFLARYLKSRGIVLSYEFFMCLACLFFSIFYVFLMKYKKNSHRQITVSTKTAIALFSRLTRL